MWKIGHNYAPRSYVCERYEQFGHGYMNISRRRYFFLTFDLWVRINVYFWCRCHAALNRKGSISTTSRNFLNLNTLRLPISISQELGAGTKRRQLFTNKSWPFDIIIFSHPIAQFLMSLVTNKFLDINFVLKIYSFDSHRIWFKT